MTRRTSSARRPPSATTASTARCWHTMQCTLPLPATLVSWYAPLPPSPLPHRPRAPGATFCAASNATSCRARGMTSAFLCSAIRHKVTRPSTPNKRVRAVQVGLVNTHYVYLPIPTVISAPRMVSFAVAQWPWPMLASVTSGLPTRGAFQACLFTL